MQTGWSPEMTGVNLDEGVGVLFRARRPFHPERLRELMSAGLDGVLRAKGVVWLATQMRRSINWMQAGGSLGLDRGPIWYGAVPVEQWSMLPGRLMETMQHWEEPYGDRRQELLLLGPGLDEAALVKALNRCLLNDEEFSDGPASWQNFKDPFPDFDAEMSH